MSEVRPAPQSGAGDLAPPPCLLLSTWFGLLTGLVTAGTYGVSKFALHRYVHVNLHLAWMAPLANLLLFLVPGVLLAVLSRVFPKLVTARVVITLLGFLAAYSVSFRATGLHRGAAALLAAGLGYQFARLTASRMDRYLTLVRKTAVAALLLTAVSAAGMFAWQAWAERRAVASLPPGQKAPNVLLIVLDTVRGMSLSLYGFPKPTTPQLEALAKGGVRFDRAFSAAPWTLTSHASLMTGHWPHELSATWKRPLDDAYPTLAEALRSRGYLTAGFVANTYYCSFESGLNRGFAHYEDYPVSLVEILRSSDYGKLLTNTDWLRRVFGRVQKFGRLTAEDINREFLAWVADGGDRPFFAFLNYYDAHASYDAPPPFDSLFDARLPRQNLDLGPQNDWTQDEIRAHQHAYEASIAYLDHQLGLLFAELRRRDLLDNTLVIVTSDHGEEFKEHGVMGHGNTLYRPAVQVPLLLRLPGRIPAGGVVDYPVSTRNLAATITDLTGLGADPRFPGRSLGPLLELDSSSIRLAADTILAEVDYASFQPPAYPVSSGPLRSVVKDGHRYIVNGKGREELYDFELDPMELRDLAGDGGAAPTLESLRSTLQVLLTRGSEQQEREAGE